jgi:translation initiation factor IF-2
VKTIRDEYGKELLAAGPSTPVKITGLSGVPAAGSEFIVVKSEKEAKEISEKREGQKNVLLLQKKKISPENFLQDKAQSNAKKNLKLILKADVQGSLEALKTSLRKLPSEKVELTFIAEGVGEVSESDIQYAATSKAIIIGFHTGVESHAESLIKQTKVDVRLHDIIYHAVDDVRDLMTALLDKIPQENELGEAVVKAVFKSSQLGNIAGCQIITGSIKRNCHARLTRNDEVLWKGTVGSLKRVKEDVKEVTKGQECGILLQGFNDYQENDKISAYEIIYLQQELT